MPFDLRGCLLLGAVLAVGCFTDNPTTSTTDEPASTGEAASSTGGCPVGSEGCACTPGGSCDGELACLSMICVDASADSTASATGMTSPCGNGEVDDDEECDGDPGCDEACQLVDYICNPYNQVGCAETQTCDRTRGNTLADQRTGCFQAGEAEYQAPCEYDPLDPALQCAGGMSCVGSGFVPGCEGLVECCTPFCLISQPMCPEPEMECLTWKEVGMPPGLDDLGLCIRL